MAPLSKHPHQISLQRLLERRWQYSKCVTSRLCPLSQMKNSVRAFLALQRIPRGTSEHDMRQSPRLYGYVYDTRINDLDANCVVHDANCC